MVRTRTHAFELALVLADLALDLGDAEVDRAVHVLGRLVTGNRQPVVKLEAHVDAVVVTFGREDNVTGDRIWQVFTNSLHSLTRVRLKSIGRFHVSERHRELHRAPPKGGWYAFDDTN